MLENDTFVLLLLAGVTAVLLILGFPIVMWNPRPPLRSGLIILQFSTTERAQEFAYKQKCTSAGYCVYMPHRSRSQEEGDKRAFMLALREGASSAYFKFREFRQPNGNITN